VLQLSLSSFSGKARISCDSASAAQLQALRSRFASSATVSNDTFELSLDDLLVNLRELAAWPVTDDDIRWQPELLGLVEGNAADALAMQAQLAGGPAQPSADLALPTSWQAQLTDCQERDVTKLLALTHGANFSVPGAGKTRATLALFETHRAAGNIARMLVVCPKAAYESWQDEVLVCALEPTIRVCVMDSSQPPNADIILINYERLPDAQSSLMNWLRVQPAMLVLDEAHRMKLGPAGAWGATCLALAPYATKRLILTGTPAPNGAKDLENLLAFLWPGQGRSIVADAFRQGDLRAASGRIRPLFVRTTKQELKLPPVDIAVRRVTMPPLHRELYNALLGQFSAQWRTGHDDVEALGKVILYLLMAATTPALLAAGGSRYEPLAYRVPPMQPTPGSSLAELMRDLPHYELAPKYQEIAAIVAANAADGRKTLVWSTFVRNLTSLHSLLAAYGPAIVHGGTPDRAAQLARFRTDPSCFVLLSNPATLGEGVSLHQVCHDAVYVDRDFAAGRFLQSLDRIHRLGLPPELRTRITIMVTDGTIDELVEQRLATKLQFMGTVLDDPAVLELADLVEEATISAGMNDDDVSELLGYLSANDPA